jgi:hypothetical protein
MRLCKADVVAWISVVACSGLVLAVPANIPVLFEPGWKLREAIKVFWTIPVTLRGPTPHIIVARATRCNSPHKCLSSLFSIAPSRSRRGHGMPCPAAVQTPRGAKNYTAPLTQTLCVAGFPKCIRAAARPATVNTIVSSYSR